MQSDPLILVFNAGSSSLKLIAFTGTKLVLRANVERTNQCLGTRQFQIFDEAGQVLFNDTLPDADISTPLRIVHDTLSTRLPGQQVVAVGHRY